MAGTSSQNGQLVCSSFMAVMHFCFASIVSIIELESVSIVAWLNISRLCKCYVCWCLSYILFGRVESRRKENYGQESLKGKQFFSVWEFQGKWGECVMTNEGKNNSFGSPFPVSTILRRKWRKCNSHFIMWFYLFILDWMSRVTISNVDLQFSYQENFSFQTWKDKTTFCHNFHRLYFLLPAFYPSKLGVSPNFANVVSHWVLKICCQTIHGVMLWNCCTLIL